MDEENWMDSYDFGSLIPDSYTPDYASSEDWGGYDQIFSGISDPYSFDQNYADSFDFNLPSAYDFGLLFPATEDTSGISYAPLDTSNLLGVDTGSIGNGTGITFNDSLRTPMGLDGVSAHNLPGGLTVQGSDNGLSTGATKDYYGDHGTGLLVSGAPDKPTSLNDLSLLGSDSTLGDWAKNSSIPWQEYANSNGYQSLVDKLGLSGSSPILQSFGSTAQKPATSGGSSGGGGGGSTPKQSTTPAKSTLQQGLSNAAMLAQLIQALGAKGVKPPAPDAANNRGAQSMTWKRFAHGGTVPGAPSGHAGALGLLRGNHPGQSDKVHAKMSHGEYIFDADTVANLGDGNTEAGAAALDEMRRNIREHKRSAPADQIPPKAKSPLAYLKGSK